MANSFRTSTQLGSNPQNAAEALVLHLLCLTPVKNHDPQQHLLFTGLHGSNHTSTWGQKEHKPPSENKTPESAVNTTQSLDWKWRKFLITQQLPWYPAHQPAEAEGLNPSPEQFSKHLSCQTPETQLRESPRLVQVCPVQNLPCSAPQPRSHGDEEQETPEQIPESQNNLP